MSQNTGEKGMYGSLAGKSDLMGGILDRWINTLPESVVFDKIILPNVIDVTKGQLKVITDFYKYNPTQETTGIAPDVIGIKYNDTVIPLAVFDEKWTAVDDRPQIEVKSFKKSQQMVSLRDQGYRQKYLVMAETNFRVDYLLPLFDLDLLKYGVYEEMTMNDKVFLKSDPNNYISHLKEVDFKDKSLGTISLLCVTTGQAFEEVSTYCEADVSPIRVSGVQEVSKCIGSNINCRISDISDVNRFGLSSYKTSYYDGTTKDGIPYLLSNGKEHYCRYLDFYADKPDCIFVIKKNKSSLYVKTTDDVRFNEFSLKKDKIYLISFTELPRTGSQSGEYFFQKSLMDFVPNYEDELVQKLRQLVELVDNK